MATATTCDEILRLRKESKRLRVQCRDSASVIFDLKESIFDLKESLKESREEWYELLDMYQEAERQRDAYKAALETVDEVLSGTCDSLELAKAISASRLSVEP